MFFTSSAPYLHTLLSVLLSELSGRRSPCGDDEDADCQLATALWTEASDMKVLVLPDCVRAAASCSASCT